MKGPITNETSMIARLETPISVMVAASEVDFARQA
jgi:hypothetical protein